MQGVFLFPAKRGRKWACPLPSPPPPHGLGWQFRTGPPKLFSPSPVLQVSCKHRSFLTTKSKPDMPCEFRTFPEAEEVAIEVNRITERERDKVLSVEEGHFSDSKAI